MSGSYIEPLWNVWRLTTSPTFSMFMLQEQYNDGTNRYTNNNAQVLNAITVSVAPTSIYVASIAAGFDPYLNFYGDLVPPCDNGLFSGIPLCEFCGYDTTVRGSCKDCSNAPVCKECFSETYLTAAKLCLACPTECYTCSAAATCTGCVGGYVLVGSTCKVENITGCGTSRWDSGDSVTRCV